MSGVVNKEVAERAHQVKADELIRKPFHPQDLVVRVKKLLNRAEPGPAAPPAGSGEPGSPLSRFFECAADAFPKSAPPPVHAPAPSRLLRACAASAGRCRGSARPLRPTPRSLQKLRMEVKRLESLVKKLQTELASEREYCATLESQLQSAGAAD